MQGEKDKNKKDFLTSLEVYEVNYVKLMVLLPPLLFDSYCVDGFFFVSGLDSLHTTQESVSTTIHKPRQETKLFCFPTPLAMKAPFNVHCSSWPEWNHIETCKDRKKQMRRLLSHLLNFAREFSELKSLQEDTCTSTKFETKRA